MEWLYQLHKPCFITSDALTLKFCLKGQENIESKEDWTGTLLFKSEGFVWKFFSFRNWSNIRKGNKDFRRLGPVYSRPIIYFENRGQCAFILNP